MKPANALMCFSSALWCGAAVAQVEQSVDFGGRFSAVSLSTWLWSFGILVGGVLFRMALDIRARKLTWDANYLAPTVATCMACGFFAIGATEWYIGKGNSLNPFTQMGAIIAASINSEIVLRQVKRLTARMFGGTVDDVGSQS